MVTPQSGPPGWWGSYHLFLGPGWDEGVTKGVRKVRAGGETRELCEVLKLTPVIVEILSQFSSVQLLSHIRLFVTP